MYYAEVVEPACQYALLLQVGELDVQEPSFKIHRMSAVGRVQAFAALQHFFRLRQNPDQKTILANVRFKRIL